ncbi:hypothetical protein B0H67DRAFT_645841 [Lasiosphaeris hirsuta]|uniref:ORC1/DEAH AAA+ ATPase domain-containing protein n=1 Tax=Lasiosphaeris hirsuta TaxID=260670 RepID=A0AA40DYF0_9PEZI|nr:hypothetical protein B0H67DRAFT_645841 [Lasiosphaeris hirsuta]
MFLAAPQSQINPTPQNSSLSSQAEEPDSRPEIEVLPACVQGFRETSAIAIVKFRSDRHPSFLDSLVRDPLGQLEIPYDTRGSQEQDNVTFDRHFHGFTQLYPTRPDRPVVADIIAITGMDGHAYGSWMSREGHGDMWLRNFLSRDFPYCRTMIYGYESKLLATNINELQEYGRLFLTEIEKIRDNIDLQQRPLIFICHSYGGIILSYSLVQSSNAHTVDNQAARHSVYKSTYGMLFFGTPHRGLREEDFLKMVEHKHPNRIPAVLQIKPESGRLLDQLGHLKDIVGDRQIASFYELKPTPTLSQASSGQLYPGPLEMLTMPGVSEHSATIQLPTHQERKIPVDANHRDMVKFNSRGDLTYTTVRKILGEFTRDAPAAVQQRYDPQSSGASQAPCNVPFARSANFVGREDILASLEHIYNSPDCHHSAALTGLGGIGKSAIAINYARRHRRRHPEASVWWVQASTVATFSQSYREIAEILQLEGRNEPKVDILRLVYDYLSDEKNGPWLIILDNADDRTLFEPAAPAEEGGGDTEAGQPPQSPLSYLPQGRHGSILITSRDRRVAEDFAGSTSSIIAVDALDDFDSVQLLRQRSGDRKSPEQDAVRLVKSLDNIPLAITQAAAFISGDGTSIEWFNNTLYEEGFKHPKQDSALSIRVPPAALLSWRLSFDVIREKYKNSVKLLSLMSIFHNDDVPAFLFTDNMTEYARDARRFQEDIKPLLRFNLMIIDGQNFDMHRLVQAGARSWLADHHELHQCVREARALVSDAFPDISSGLENLKKCLALLPHAEAALALDAGPEHAGQMKQAGKLRYNMAYCQYIIGDYRSALRHSLVAKDIQSQFVPADDKEAIQTKDLISRLRSALGQGEKALRELDLELVQHRGSDKSGYYSSAYLTLLEERARLTLDMALSPPESEPGGARTAPDAAKLAEAEAQARHVLQLMSAATADGGSVPESHRLDARRTLARAISLQGAPEQAEALFRAVLARRTQLWGLGHVDTLKSVSDLAQCLAAQGRFAEALGYFDTAADGLRRFSRAENSLAAEVQRARALAEQESRRGGWGWFEREARAWWRRVGVKVFGSPRAVVPRPAVLDGVAGSIRVSRGLFVMVVLLPIVVLLVLGALSLQARERFVELGHRLREEWTREDRHLSEKIEHNQALDKSQDEEIRRLEMVMKDQVRELKAEIQRLKKGGR